MPAPVLAASDLALRLRAGEAAIIPTDTLPGLAVLPDQAQTLWLSLIHISEPTRP